MTDDKHGVAQRRDVEDLAAQFAKEFYGDWRVENEISGACKDDSVARLIDLLTRFAVLSSVRVEAWQPMLWCCHVRGPDDVYAAPDYETALLWSDVVNETNWRKSSRLNIPDPTSYEDCLVKAAPAPWPHSRESHAENLPKSIACFTSPPMPEDLSDGHLNAGDGE